MSNCLGHPHYMSRRDIGLWVRGTARAAAEWPLPAPDVMIGDIGGYTEATIRAWLDTRPKLTAPRDPWVPPCVQNS